MLTHFGSPLAASRGRFALLDGLGRQCALLFVRAKRRLMTERKTTAIDGGSAEYWRQRTEGFRLIHEAEHAAQRLANAPMYLHGGYDEDGDVIAIENFQPNDDMEAAVRAIEANETAVSILVGQARTYIGGYEIRVVTRALAPDYGGIEDPDRNPLWGPDTD